MMRRGGWLPLFAPRLVRVRRGHCAGVRLHVRVARKFHHLRVVRLVHALALVRLLLPARASYSYAAAGETAWAAGAFAATWNAGAASSSASPGASGAPRELPPVVVVARGQRRGLVREVHVPDLVPEPESVLRREPTHPLW